MRKILFADHHGLVSCGSTIYPANWQLRCLNWTRTLEHLVALLILIVTIVAIITIITFTTIIAMLAFLSYMCHCHLALKMFYCFPFLLSGRSWNRASLKMSRKWEVWRFIYFDWLMLPKAGILLWKLSFQRKKNSRRATFEGTSHMGKSQNGQNCAETGLRAVKCMQCEAIVCDPGTISTNSNFNGVCFSFGGIVCLLRVLRLWSLLSMPAQCTHWCEKQ